MTLDRPYKPRPLTPSLRRQYAQWLALSDPRCDSAPHARTAEGENCAVCGRNLWNYLPMVPEDWCP